MSAGSQGWGNAIEPVLNPVQYSTYAAPGERFTTMAPSTIPRLYHSTASLLQVSTGFVISKPTEFLSLELFQLPHGACQLNPNWLFAHVSGWPDSFSREQLPPVLHIHRRLPDWVTNWRFFPALPCSFTGRQQTYDQCLPPCDHLQCSIHCDGERTFGHGRGVS